MKPQPRPHWIKKYWRPITLILTLLAFTIIPIIKYYSAITYTDKKLITVPTSVGFNIMAYSKIKYSASNAFMPNETIHVDIEITFVDKKHPEYLAIANSGNFMVHFDGAAFCDTVDYGKNQIGRPIPDSLFFLNPVNLEGVPVKLSLFEYPNVYRGSANLKYSKAAVYPVYYNLPNGIVDGVKIEGSTVDIMNKKTNDILYILAIFNVAFLIYREFVKKN